MNTATKLFMIIKQLVRKPWLLNKVLEAEDAWISYVSSKHGLRNGLPAIRASQITGTFEGRVHPIAFLDGASLPTDLLLLRLLAQKFNDCRYFEIGTWRGESVANVAEVAGECYTLNLSDEQMRSMGMNERYISLHRFFSRNLPNVVHLEGDSRNFDFSSLDKKFDLVFIDGDHHYEMVKNDTEKVFRHLVHPGSIVVWHDYARNPETIRHEVLAGILDGAPAQYHGNIYYVENTLCAVYTAMNLPTREFESPKSPGTYFDLTIKAD